MGPGELEVKLLQQPSPGTQRSQHDDEAGATQRLLVRNVARLGGLFQRMRGLQPHMDKNKRPEDLPEDETSHAFECITMDIFQSEAGEHGLAIADRHTGYT